MDRTGRVGHRPSTIWHVTGLRKGTVIGLTDSVHSAHGIPDASRAYTIRPFLFPA